MSRRQLPVHSPLPFRAVLAGLSAAITDGVGGRERIRAAIAERFEPRELLLTDSGTSALTLALRAAERQRPGAPVALPAFSCYDLATAAVGAGVDVALYDLEPETLSPRLESLETVLKDGASALVLAHLYGIPVDVRPVLELASSSGVPVIEDAAQGLGARYEGLSLGSFGSLAVLSFGRGKGVTGCGGGALLANDARGTAMLRTSRRWLLPRLSPAGWDRLPALIGQWALARPGLYGIPAALPFLELGETVYREPGPTTAQSALSAGTLSVTWELQEKEREVRRKNAKRLLRRIRGPESGAVPIRSPARSEPGYLRLPVLRDHCRDVPGLTTEAARRLGVMPGYPATLAELEAARTWLRPTHAGLEGARRLSRHLFTLPTHSLLTERDLGALEDLVSGTPAGTSGSLRGDPERQGWDAAVW